MTALLVMLGTLNVGRSSIVAGPSTVTMSAGENIALSVTTTPGLGANYSVAVDGTSWLESGPFAFTINGATYSTISSCTPNCLALSSAYPAQTSGVDSTYGDYTELTLAWKAGTVAINTIFRSYSALPVLVFSQHFPDGAKGTLWRHTTSGVSSAFPSWQMKGNDLMAFAGQNQGSTVGRWHGGKFGGGTTGGSPLVLYKAQPAAGGRGVGGAPALAPAPAPSASSNAKYRSIVMSPMDNFMAGALEHPAAILSGEGEDAYSVGGLFATLTEVPAGYTHPTVLVGGHGISSAVMDWGDVLLKKTRKERTNYLNHPTDISLTHIGYWTDNGAWYHYLCSECCGGGGAQNPCPCPMECAGRTTMEDVMLEVKEDMAERDIPMKYFMFDSWWYPKEGDPAANASKPWPVRGGAGELSWTPEPQVFPSGIKPWLGLPTFLHARYLAPDNVYRNIPELADKMICEEGGPQPSPPPSPSPSMSCRSQSYCEHDGVYCDGKDRVLLKSAANGTLDACEELCSASQHCNCASFAQAFKHAGSECRIFSGVTKLTESSQKFNAYIKPGTGAPGTTSAYAYVNPGTPPSSSNGICLPVDKLVFQHMMQGVAGWSPFVYEQDWITTAFGKSTALTNNTETGNTWLGAMNDAAISQNMTVQFSMSHTAAILQSSKMPAVTQIRGSADYTAGSSSWQIGETSMMYWALGAVASKDTFFTLAHQPGCPKAGAYNCTEPNVEIQVIMSTLGGGPVGPGDRLNLTDRALTMRSCNADGRILRASRPITPLNLAFPLPSASTPSSPSSSPSSSSSPAAATAAAETALSASAGAGAAGVARSTNSARGDVGVRQLLSAYTTIASSVYHYVFFELRGSVTLYPSDLLQPCSNTTLGAQRCAAAELTVTAAPSTYVAAVITQTGGAWPPASQTLQIVADDSPLVLQSNSGVAVGRKGEGERALSPGQVPFTYVVLAPQRLSGSAWTVFGELDKVTPVSPSRFGALAVNVADGSLKWGVAGAPNEVVHISYTAVKEGGKGKGEGVPRINLETMDCMLGSTGTAVFSCAGAGPCVC